MGGGLVVVGGDVWSHCTRVGGWIPWAGSLQARAGQLVAWLALGLGALAWVCVGVCGALCGITPTRAHPLCEAGRGEPRLATWLTWEKNGPGWPLLLLDPLPWLALVVVGEGERGEHVCKRARQGGGAVGEKVGFLPKP